MTRPFILAALLLALGAPAAGAWTSPVFHSPSGNIRCAYRGWNDSLVCATAAPRRSVTLRRYGVPRTGYGWLPLRGPVLPYGGSAWNDTYQCDSDSWGMTCFQLYGEHGFTIARAGVSRW